MIDIKRLEKSDEYQAQYKRNLAARGGDESDVERLLELNKARKAIIADAEQKKALQNKVGEEIARKKRSKEDASQELKEMQELSKTAKQLHSQAEEADHQLHQILLSLPNHLHPEVPEGNSDEHNKEIRKWGEPRDFGFAVKDHVELGEKLGIVDFARATKVSGSRFVFLQGLGAQLNRALVNFFVDLHTKDFGYQEIAPPFVVNNKSLEGTGQLPKFAEDLFSLSGTNYYLIPTAEVPVTNYFADEILEDSELPHCFAAYSPCFRSEAGSHGRDTRGMIRQHQFEKVEMVKFTHPDESYSEHDKLVGNAETILQKLGLPYRVVVQCSGDIGFGAAKCYDVEVWLPGQQKYREISSCSNYEDFQARRANIRFRPQGGSKPQFVHTLNGSGLPTGRTLVAILETYQNEDGSVDIPEALQPYMGGTKKIEKPS